MGDSMHDALSQLSQFDNEALLALNGSNSVYWDAVMWIVTQTVTWIPLLLVLLYVVMKNSSWRSLLLFVLAMALTVALADRLSSGVIKPLVMRWRPTHDATFLHTIDTVFGYTGGRFGFVSSHAANTFSLFVLLSLILRSGVMSVALFLWACLSSYSRIYLGVHFPGDILCGALLGMAVGFIVYLLYAFLASRLDVSRQYYSTAYTSSGFLQSDMHVLLLTFAVTYAAILLLAIPLAAGVFTL